MLKFKVGDRVKIIPGTRYYYGESDSNNPKDIEGTVTKAEEPTSIDSNYSVMWDNKMHNGYHEKDLMLVNSELFPIY